MTKTPSRLRRLVLSTLGVALVAAAAVPAGAQEPPNPTAGADKGEQADSRGIPVRAGIGSQDAERLADRLGPDRTGGVYLDQESRRMVVTVTDAAAEQAVIDAGGLADRVTYSTKDLRVVTDTLDESIDTPGTSWGTDIDDNRINVLAYSTVSSAEFAELEDVLEPYGDAAKLTRHEGKLELNGPVNGGKSIVSDDGVGCSAGFNVRKKDNNDLFHEWR